jgi:hypothetical protein
MIKLPEPAAVLVLTTLVCSGPGRMITLTAGVRRGRLVQEAGWSSGVPLWHRGQSPAGHTWLGMVVAAWKGRPSVPVTTVLARPMASSVATATEAAPASRSSWQLARTAVPALMASSTTATRQPSIRSHSAGRGGRRPARPGRAGIGGQERGAKHAGDHQGQERPAGQGPAHRAGLIPAEPVGKALDIGPEPVREQEQLSRSSHRSP